MTAGTPATSYAGFWRRVVATLLDGIILSLVNGLLFGRPNSWALFDTANLASTAITWLYFTGFECSSLQATPGKLALGLKVMTTSGGRLAFGRATGRHFAKLISALILGIGFMMAGWTEKKQALHDMMTDCLVVKRA